MTLIVNGRKKMNNSTTYKYFAFISYNQKDTKWGKRLQRKLESYKMPATLCSDRGWKRKPMQPVFFAPYEIQPGDLDEELKARLRASQHLIVVCSPHSAQSEWVGKEIRYFHSLGRADRIYFFIIDGVPNSGNEETECYNPVIKELGLANYLGVNINEQVFHSAYLNRERAYVQLVTKLLGVEFDAIWQRHRRLLIEKAVAWCLGTVLVLSALYVAWTINRPVDVNVGLRETSVVNASLPPLRDVKVTLTLGNDKITKVISDINHTAIFPNIPRKELGKEVRVTVTDSLNLYHRTDTTLTLLADMTLDICRNPSQFGTIRFRLIDSKSYQPVAHCRIVIEGIEGMTDDNGNVAFTIPLSKQRTKYHIQADVPLADSTCNGAYDDDGFVVFAQ